VQRLAVQGDRLQRPMRRVEDGAPRGLVDAPRLHSHVAVLHQVHPADAVLAAQSVDPLEERHRPQPVAVHRHRVAPLEVDLDVDGHVRLPPPASC